ncbi:MAG: Do family serine endopeptidase [Candidatus Cloacimonetes bacterium]|nr:Do family serine endopeptidase [Candidatus Cloacimonadota bacterium]
MNRKTTLVLLLMLLMAFILQAQLPLTDGKKSPFVEVIKNIRESVVNIRVEFEVNYNQSGSGFPFNDDFFKFFFPDLPRSNQPQTRKSLAMGSGFIFRKDGNEVYVITNNHVVENGKTGEIIVTLADKAKYKAEIVGLDSQTDLAIIKISVDEEEDITVAPMGNSDNLEIGDWAIAIGNPFGQLGLERTVTVGVISATGRANLQFGVDSPLYQDYIQTDAAINPGNSGGPLVNIEGEVIGVNAAITSTSGGNMGIGFAIPINLVSKVASDLINEGVVIRAYIGILPQEIDYELQKTMKLDQITGVLVAKVEENTPAEEAGLKKGDVILKFNDREVPNVAKFRIEVANSDIGRELPVEIIRDGKRKTLQVKLIQRPDDELQLQNKPEVEKSGKIGIDVEGMDGNFAQQHNLEEASGVVITGVQVNSPAAEAGLRAGDIILEIDQQEVKNLKNYYEIIANLESDLILLYIKSVSGIYRFVTVNIK